MRVRGRTPLQMSYLQKKRKLVPVSNRPCLWLFVFGGMQMSVRLSGQTIVRVDCGESNRERGAMPAVAPDQ